MRSMSNRSLVRFGTSSWAYEGWRNQIYHRPYPASRFSKDSLAEYAAYQTGGVPLFRTVGIDHSFYRPASTAQLAHYARQVPADFHFCSKVWEELTVPAYAHLPRYGAKAGQPNPRFLDRALFRELVLQPFREALPGQIGPFIFEFQRTGMEPSIFLNALDRFLADLPTGFPYAVEIRNPAVLSPRYREILLAHQVAHTYNHWTGMPPLLARHRLLNERFTAPFVVMPLLTPLGLPYGEAVERYAPYNRIVTAQPQMRREAASLIQAASSHGITPYVLVNNRLEGNAPLTIQAIVESLTALPDSAALPPPSTRGSII
ncbi:MAG: DUF72 domain-containing protein [Nitrospira sp. CR1.1]|nr:DUF72 domain-containing protein [Nitrospira sp. CR1.1]